MPGTDSTYGGSPPTAGFGNCKVCAYFLAGAPDVCFACASATMQLTAPDSCDVCNQTLVAPGTVCANSMCNSADRQFEWIVAVAMKTGELERAIWALKAGKWGWGVIFARVILGFLRRYPAVVRNIDMLVPMPAYLGANQERRSSDHAGWVIEQAMVQDNSGLPFVMEPPVIVKTRPVGRMRDAAGLAGRGLVARQLYDALQVPNPYLVNRRNIMVYDDVFTSGNSLNEVARRLRKAGAAHVVGLCLSRQPWSTR